MLDPNLTRQQQIQQRFCRMSLRFDPSFLRSSTMSRTTGSVVLQVGALELLARYSMASGRATSVMSSIHEFRTQEAEQAGNKQWNWKYLRVI